MQYPLYGSAFFLYRSTPLHHGKTPSLANLNLHARRLHQEITGDSMRGIQIANDQDGVPNGPNTGALQSCTWELLADEASWERAQAELNVEDEISGITDVDPQDAVGIRIELKFERSTHLAIFLGDPRRKSARSGFTSFPLLLVKMTPAIRQLFLNYIATAFDVKVTSMKLRSPFMASLLENILDATAVHSASTVEIDMATYPKGLQLQLSLPSVNPQLKTIEITLSQDDMANFIRHGQELWAQPSLNVNPPRSNYLPSSKSPVAGPFTAALAKYLSHHLALDFEHPAVTLDQVVIEPFKFTSDGKIRILEKSPEAQEIWEMLLEQAQGQRMLDKQEVLKQREKSLTKESAANESQPISRPPTEPPPPYELHDPALRDELG
jgi:Kinetochore complex Sim4 subunit Fta1